MRKTMTGFLAVGVLLLGACGGDDDDKADDGTKTDEESTDNPITGDGPAADTPFCQDVLELFNGSTNVDAASEAIAAAREIEPPDELADDWDKWISGVAEMSSPDVTLDPSDPAAAAAYQEVYEAAGNVFAYIGTECGAEGFAPPSTDPTATTGG